MNSIMGRHDARIAVMRAAFSIDYDLDETVSSESVFDGLTLDKHDMNYFDKVIDGIKSNISTIDETIKSCLKNWTIERLPKVDLAILQVAVYEIIYCEDIPVGATINEAVNIAKEYSTDDSGKFVNGVLSGVLKKVK